MKLIALMPPLSLIKSLSINYKPLLCSSVVQIKFVNNDFIWSVTYSSYCIVLIKNWRKKKLITYTFEYDKR